MTSADAKTCIVWRNTAGAGVGSGLAGAKTRRSRKARKSRKSRK